MVKLCPECGGVNSHHPNCPLHDEADFISNDEDWAYDDWKDEEARKELEDIDDVD
jgi:hypothetical protein